MPLGVLNNISAVYAENNLNQTQSSLQNVLTQLSSGSKINSGADDPAGLSIANGLAANSAALSQSSSNASEGAGFLQVADGALSQVTSLLTSAVTLATEAGGGTLSGSQLSAANQEYQDILTQIGTIGSTTEYNGLSVFSSDTSMSALSWAQGTGTPATSAAATASQVLSGAITPGGTTAGIAEVAAGTYAAPGNLTWTAGGSGTSSVMTTGPIASGSELSGTLAFTPTHSGGGSPNAISVNLGTTLTAGTSLSAQAIQLATAINTQAGNANEYTVTVVNGDELQIGMGTHAATDDLTGFNVPASAPATSGTVAAQTAASLTAASNDSLTGTLTLTSQSTTPAGTPANVVFAGSGSSTVTGTITSGDALSGTISIGASIPAGSAQPIVWSNNGASDETETFTTTINTANTLTGSFTFGASADTNGPYTVDLSALHGETQAEVISTIQGDITGGTSNPSDYSIQYNSTSGQLTIGLSSTGLSDFTSGTFDETDGTSTNAPKQATPLQTLGPTVVNLNGVTTGNGTTGGNLASTIQAALGSNYTVNYTAASGALTIGLSGGSGTVSFTPTGTPVQEAAPATVSSGSPKAITLAGVNTSDLAAYVGQQLNGVNNGTPAADYTVAYGSGALTVTLTSAAATAGITGLGIASNVTQTSANAASIAVADGDTLQGTLTIDQTFGSTAQTPVLVNLTGAAVDGVTGAGTSTANSGAALISAVNAALGSNAAYYNVTYGVETGTGTLSIAVNAAGQAANVSSISIANGTTNSTELSQTQTTASAITAGSSVLGNFTVTPTGSSTQAINVDLSNTPTTGLAAALQSQLGTNYLVGYNATSGALNIGVSATGAAAGITGFTVAEASAQSASVVTAPSGGVNIYTSDGTSTGSQNYNVTVGTLSDATVGTSAVSSALGTAVSVTVSGTAGTGGITAGGGVGTSLTGTKLDSQADAESALQTVDNAINAVAYQRGQVGANINTLTAASNIASSQMTNITSAQNTITATDYASATSNMSKYEILTQTGISALAQANSTQQMVTKLLQ
jgi:flagellin